MYEIYIRLFVLTPMLLYCGYSIMKNKSHISSLLFHGIVILSIFTLLFFHLKYIMHILHRVFNDEKYQKDFGIFLIFMAIFSFLWCVQDIYLNSK